MSPELKTTDPKDIFTGGGEMGVLMRSLDWSQTSLGAIQHWSQNLKTAVRIMLTSRQPMFVWWGEDLINLYNDAYRAILGGKHPEALGQPAARVWREIWDRVGPRAESAIRNNEGTYDEALLLIMERNGYLEETYYTFSYSPVPDLEGKPGGIICANTDDTQRIIDERQLALLKELASKTADARTFDEACKLSATCLATNPYDLPFGMIYLIDPERRCAVLAGTSGIESGHALAPQMVELNNEDWHFAEVLNTHEPYLISDLDIRFRDLPTGAWTRSPHQLVIVPVAPSGETGKAGILVAGLNPFRLFDNNYRRFLNLVSAQIAASIANAQAYEEEHKRAEALTELDRAKTAFFSNVSHEFRTPLTLMLGPLEEIVNACPDSLATGHCEQLEMVHRNGLRLLKLVNTLLDFSRIEAGRIQAVYEPTDLAMLTADLAGVFRSAIERAGMHLQVDCPPLPEPVYVDREMWEKIVLNLLSNAFKFTFKGKIMVALRSWDDRIELEVRDTGIGIPAEELPYIFERFHRVKGARGRSYEGSGIGLSLVQELVSLHGGTIEVSSVVDRGTSFIVSIPNGCNHLPSEHLGVTRTLTSTTMGTAPYVEEILRWLPKSVDSSETLTSEFSLSVPIQSRQSSTPTARILLADDNADMRDYVKRLLSRQYEVEVAADGIMALAAVRQQVPDLVLTDVMMPRLDGFGLLRELRVDPTTRDIPIILLSARAGEEARIEGLEAGADDYLIKPFSARELLARVEATLKLIRIRKDAGQAVRENEERLLFALTAARMVAWEWDLTTGISQRLGNAAEILGLGTSNADDFYRMVHPEDRAVVEAATARAIRGEAPYDLEFRSIAPDGRTLWLADKARLRYDDEGKPSHLTGVCVDITDRKQAEEALQQREAELRLVTDTVPALISFVDSDQRYRFNNRKYEEWFGRPATEIYGQSLREVLGEAAYEEIRPYVERVLAGQQVTFESQIPYKDEGTRYINATYVPQFNHRGAVEGFVAFS
ncbi:PAS domain-containing protein [Pleurocapsales cyanobacterium LEGE 06147]|nr:PAS domain-containing protein [Pleurocapsales cyanobacterium LEGE 06147]